VAYKALDLSIDFNGDGETNFFDLPPFIEAYYLGCP